ncbi:SusC/RagA family TonB-linked outer membrane protein [Bacteroides ihuae]|uniref:SusC/RagA family TonB-linked outer membrane protein n=1 Tax=Bacteroides ihuae TaxID=1852362 RepID=UPI0008D9A37D|nr:TonB-dependent receptor [Bacteroides ihuae]
MRKTFSRKCIGSRLCCIALLLLLLFPAMVLRANPSQDRTVSGIVTSSVDREGLIGVSVRVKETLSGTITDINGRYSLNVRIGETLVFSYVGYHEQEIKVGNQTTINVILAENSEMIDEVVVIGYGTTKRKDVTGSISSISGDEIRKSQPVTLEQALQGKIPGMVVQQISGQPGGAVSMQIHGLSSFSGSSPLWIVDGIKMNGAATLGSGVNPIAGINPSDIESIDVLKDASSTAIYGSEATNGVIVVTTKRGKVAPPTISYDFYTGYQQLMTKIPVMNLQEFATFVNERNAGIGWGFDTRPEFANPQYLGKGTDWQDELFRNAPMSSHTLSLRGGDVRTTYFLSASYLKQEGIALGSDFARTSVRLNLDNKTTDWLKIGTDIQLVNISENTNSSSSSVINTALSQTPDIAVQNTDGSWGGAYNPNGWVQQVVNPYALSLINKDKVKRNQFWGSAYAEIKFTRDLSLKNEISGGFSMATEDKFFPTYKMGLIEKTTNSAEYLFTKSVNVKVSNYLTYNHVFSEIYNTNVLIGHEAQLSRGEDVSAYRENFPSNNVQVISSGDATTAKNSGTKSQSAMESYFGRINLGINDKYLFTLNVREDGSSKYAPANRWVMTYSAAAAWRISNETFLKKIKNINDIKLRVGYGLTNNPGGRDYAYTTVLTTVSNSLSGVSQLTSQFGNPDLGWEKTKNTNIGLDAAFLDWRLNFSVDFYNRRTDGLIMQTYLPDYSATSIGWSPGAIDAPYVNIGSVSNKGFDVKISYKNIKGKDFSWNTDLTISHNANKVLKLNADGAAIDGSYSKTVVGRSIGEFYGYVFDGIYSKSSDFLGDIKLGIEPHARPVRNGEELPVGTASGSIWYGDRMYKDLNGDGIIDERDQTFLGSPIPKVQLGLNNTFSYKNFDLNIYFSANIGNKVFNQLRVNGESTSGSYGYMKILKEHARLGLIDPNGSATDVRNVYVTNPGTRIVGVRNDDTNGNNRTSDIYVEDGSFLKCKTISLGYTFSDRLLKKTPINSLRIYANVTNVFILSKYKGMDPEIGSWDPVNAGVDSGFYPQPRVFTLGLNISLNK